jgi:multiple sugar transport system substrate-binding protein/raffinose/stachyose/melibiose transport system substrate-binding protein
VDITDLWEQSGLLQTYPASFQKLSVHEGKQYYLPVGYIWTAIYYNKQVFAQYNLAPPQSWNEFVLICDTLQANDVTPISLSGRNEFQAMLWFDYLDLRLNGPQFHWDLISGLERYDDPRVREVLETWKLLFDSGYFVENPMGVNTLSSLTAIVRGDGGQLGRHKAAMVLADPNAIGELPQPFHAEIDFFRFPVINPSLPMAEVLNSFGYMIPAGGEHIPQTLQFLTFMGSVEAQNLMAQQGNTGFVPTHPGVDPELLTPTLRQGMALVEEAEVVTTPYMFSVPGAIWPVVDNGLRRFLNEPDDKDVESFMLALEAARQDAAAKGLFSSDSLP